MSTITIDGREYVVEQLPEGAKSQIVSIQFVDNEIAHLKANLAALQTARIAYGKELLALLSAIKADTIKFN